MTLVTDILEDLASGKQIPVSSIVSVTDEGVLIDINGNTLIPDEETPPPSVGSWIDVGGKPYVEFDIGEIEDRSVIEIQQMRTVSEDSLIYIRAYDPDGNEVTLHGYEANIVNSFYYTYRQAGIGVFVNAEVRKYGGQIFLDFSATGSIVHSSHNNNSIHSENVIASSKSDIRKLRFYMSSNLDNGARAIKKPL